MLGSLNFLTQYIVIMQSDHADIMWFCHFAHSLFYKKLKNRQIFLKFCLLAHKSSFIKQIYTMNDYFALFLFLENTASEPDAIAIIARYSALAVVSPVFTALDTLYPRYLALAFLLPFELEVLPFTIG